MWGREGRRGGMAVGSPNPMCAHVGVHERDRGGGRCMFLAGADSNYISVCMLLKVPLPVKVETFEKIDKSPVITRNYFHA